jgi:hypothetical protein
VLVPPVPLVPVAPVPVPVVVFDPGRRIPVSLAVPVPERARPTLSLIVPVLLPPIELEPLVPVPPVPDIEPEAPIPVSVPVPIVPLLVPVAPVPDVPTSPPLIPAVLSRLLPLLQAPTASTAASASTLLPIVTLRMSPSPRCCVNVAAFPAGGHPIRIVATRVGRGRKRGAIAGVE